MVWSFVFVVVLLVRVMLLCSAARALVTESRSLVRSLLVYVLAVWVSRCATWGVAVGLSACLSVCLSVLPTRCADRSTVQHLPQLTHEGLCAVLQETWVTGGM